MAGDAARTIEPVRNAPEIEAAYARVPEGVRCEILNGFLLMSPKPRVAHQNTASQLGALLVPPFRMKRGGPGGWVILDEPELHLGPGPDKMEPDLAGWRRSRMPKLPRAPEITLAPDWVCEILSPGTEVTDRGVKLPIYEREGVSSVWLIDPEAQTLEVFSRTHDRLRPSATFRGDAVVRAEPFDAIDLELALLWEE